MSKDVKISGLSEEKVQELKEKHGKVYLVNLARYEFVYRPLLREEYLEFQKEIMKGLQENGALDPNTEGLYEEKMIGACLVYPENFTFEGKEAGLQSSLAGYIYAASGFNPQAEPIEL